MSNELQSQLESFFLAGDLGALRDCIATMNIIESSPTIIRYKGIVELFNNREVGLQFLDKASAYGDKLSRRIINCVFEFDQSNQIFNLDLLRSAIELSQLRSSYYIDYPTEVSIETQAVCNAACSFCPYPTIERKGQKMSDELLDKIIIDLLEIPPEVRFGIAPFKVSDPFLDKRIFDFSKRINRELPNADLRFFTNGAPLTDKNLEKLAEISNITHLWISLNDSDSDRYEKLMGIPFAKTIERMDSLHRMVQNGYPHQICVSRVQDFSNGDAEFLRFVRDRYPLFRGMITKRSNWVGQISTNFDKTVPPVACGRWFEISIMSTGKVALCCMDGEGNHVIGDVNNASVLDIYNSPSFRKMRQFLSSRKGAASPCDTCNL